MTNDRRHRTTTGSPPRRSKHRRLPLAVLLIVLAVISSAGAKAGWGARTPESAVIVRAVPGSDGCAQAAVTRMGGGIGLRLRIIHGFAAHLSPQAVVALRKLSCVASVTPDTVVHPEA